MWQSEKFSALWHFIFLAFYNYYFCLLVHDCLKDCKLKCRPNEVYSEKVIFSALGVSSEDTYDHPVGFLCDNLKSHGENISSLMVKITERIYHVFRYPTLVNHGWWIDARKPIAWLSYQQSVQGHWWVLYDQEIFCAPINEKTRVFIPPLQQKLCYQVVEVWDYVRKLM